ncbi:MAG: bacteriohemerythrin [Desulfobulbaceae bacterium]|nr:bacteriohemerythrin [Desulfobulbaceae bacterium]
MPLLQWKDKHSVGIAEIDAQHQRMFAIMNELNDAMSTEKAKSVLEGILERLIQYTATHFVTEERLMNEFGFSGHDSHRRVHEQLAAKVRAFQADFHQGRVAMSIDVMHFLMEWLEQHILGTDMEYRTYLTSRGAK